MKRKVEEESDRLLQETEKAAWDARVEKEEEEADEEFKNDVEGSVLY